MKDEKEQCKVMVWRSWVRGQCSRAAWKDGYCKQHHPDSAKERDRKTIEMWEQKQRNSPWILLANAREEIRELKDEVKRLKEAK